MDEKVQLTKQLIHILAEQFINDNREANAATIIANSVHAGLLTLQDNEQIVDFLKQLATLNPYLAIVLAVSFSTHQTIPSTWITLNDKVTLTNDVLNGQQQLLPGASLMQQLLLIRDDHVYQCLLSDLHIEQDDNQELVNFKNTNVKPIMITNHDWQLDLLKYLTAVLAQWQHDMVGYLVEYGKNTLVDGYGLAMWAPTQAKIATIVALASSTKLQAQAILNLQPQTEAQHEQIKVAIIASWQALQKIYQTLKNIFDQNGYDDQLLWQKWQHAYVTLQSLQALDPNSNAAITYAEMHKQR